MITALKHFGFGNSFQKWVSAFYKQINSCIRTNNWLSEKFTIQRGIRQGCPLSALLFLIAAEILACKIKQNVSIKGIELPGNIKRQVKIAQLADDTTLFLRDEESITEVLKTIKEFSEFAGTKLNLDKTEGMWLGQWKNKISQIEGIQWTAKPIKALGIHFGHNHKEC